MWNQHILFRISNICFIVLILCLFSGCRVRISDSEDYLPGEDFQFFQVTEAYKTSRIQETKTGCYLIHKGFVYFYNHENKTIQPLCNKPNCLHDIETDPERLLECNAHIDYLMNEESESSLMQYRDNLYVCYMNSNPEYRGSIRYTVYRIAEDGSSKELVFDTGNAMNMPLVHRGYLYYIAENHEVTENGIHSRYYLAGVNLRKNKPKEEALYVPEGAMSGYGYLQAYGNDLYFQLTASGDEADMEIGVMDIHTHKVRTVEFDGHPIRYQDNLYDIMFIRGENVSFEDYKTETHVNRVNPKTGEKTVAIEGVLNGSLLQTDGKYLYRNNAWVNYFFPEEPLHYWVYDSDMNLVDEFAPPDTERTPLGPPIGGLECQYEIFDDPDTGEWGVLVWDKSKIGSYHGAAYEQGRIVYGAK